MSIFKSRKTVPQEIIANPVSEHLAFVTDKVLLDALTEEISAWGSEPFNDERIALMDAGIDELSKRLGVRPPAGRTYLINYAEMQGVLI